MEIVEDLLYQQSSPGQQSRVMESGEKEVKKRLEQIGMAG